MRVINKRLWENRTMNEQLCEFCFLFLRILYHCYVGKEANNQRKNQFCTICLWEEWFGVALLELMPGLVLEHGSLGVLWCK